MADLYAMLDLETFGIESNALIGAIGLILWNPETGKIVSENCWFPDMEEQLSNGATVSAGTLLFWLKQSKSARASIALGQEAKAQPISAIREAMNVATGSRVDEWYCQGASFDFPILKNMFISSDPRKLLPWEFYQERDCRTMVVHHYGRGWKNKAPARDTETEYHTALGDCRYQIRMLQPVLDAKRKKTEDG